MARNGLNDAMYANPYEEVSPLIPNWNDYDDSDSEPLDAGVEDNDGEN